MTEPTTFPPVDQEPLESVVEHQRWPTVIGVLSLLYAIAGLTCVTGRAAFTAFLMDVLSAFIGEVEVPLIIKVMAIAEWLCAVVLGGMMIAGAAGTLRRRRSGVVWLKRWVIARLVVLIVFLLMSLLTLEVQVAMQKQITESQNQRAVEAGREQFVQDTDEDVLARKVSRQVAIYFGLITIYPAVLGLYLSRRKVEADLADWEP